MNRHTRARLSPVLTIRECEVIREVAYGHSNRQAGQRLYLSALTVKEHLARISGKLGASDRAHCVALAFREGYLSWENGSLVLSREQELQQREESAGGQKASTARLSRALLRSNLPDGATDELRTLARQLDAARS